MESNFKKVLLFLCAIIAYAYSTVKRKEPQSQNLGFVIFSLTESLANNRIPNRFGDDVGRFWELGAEDLTKLMFIAILDLLLCSLWEKRDNR